MKQRNFSLKIANPCHENWDNMEAREKGKYCASCTKVVVDFSQMSNAGIAEYFKTATGKVCGKFRTDQLDASYIFTHKNPFSFNTTLLRLSLAGLLTFMGTKGFSQSSNKPGNSTSLGIDNSGKRNGTDDEIIQKIEAGNVAISYLPVSVKVNMTDAKTGKPIKNGTVMVNSIHKTYYTNEKGIANVLLPDSLKDKSVSLNVYANGYETRIENVNLKTQGTKAIVLKMRTEIIEKMGEVMMIPEEQGKKCGNK